MKRMTQAWLAAALLAGAAGYGEFVAVGEGRPMATIVVGSEAEDTVRYAAERLQHYIAKATGAELPIVTDLEESASPRFLVGESRFTRAAGFDPAALGEQEYRLAAAGGDLVLLGRDAPARSWAGHTFCDSRIFQETGTVYAVDDFLRDAVGVRWYMPTELGEVVPRRDTLTVPELDVQRAPAVKHRIFHAYCWLRNIPKYFDIEFNEEFGVPDGPYISDAEAWEWARAMKMGGRPFSGGHGQMDYVERFGADHPEWFANGSPEEGGQLCYSNPELKARIVRDARDFFDGEFTGRVTFSCGDYFSVMPGDNQAWCRCDECRKWFDEAEPEVFAAPSRGYASKYVWNFVAEVAREVAETHPEGNIVCCAYADYMLPPDGLELPENVTVFICRVHSETAQPEEWAEFEAWLRSWAALTDNIVMWDYYLFPVAPTFERFPAFLPHLIDRKIKLMRELGLDAGFMAQMSETFIRNLAYDHLRIYLTARLLDDWSLDVDAVLEEYYRDFYGPAAEPMADFWNSLEEIYMRPRPASAEYREGEYDWMVMVAPEDLEHLQNALDRAAESAGGVYAERVGLIRRGVMDTMLEGRSRILANIAATRHATIPRLAAPERLTGDLADPAWAQAAELGEWGMIDGGDNVEGIAATGYAFLAGNDLYIGFRCAEPDMAGLRAERDMHDDTWIYRDDSVELFLDPGRKLDAGNYFHILVNTVPVTRDTFCRNGIAWESGAEVACVRGEDGWTLEMRLRLASLGVDGVESGERWGLNLCRTRPVRRDVQSAMQNENYQFYNWNGPWGYHKPMRFGVVEFE